MKNLTDRNHNHGKCSAKALLKAQKFCDEKKLLFSPIRQLVFKIIWNSHKAISAYDLLEILKKSNKKVVATTVYRALEFLEENSLIHKVHSSNSYIGCSFIGEKHIPFLFICNECNEVGELYKEELPKTIIKAEKNSKFKIKDPVIEMVGVCSLCQKK